MCITFHFWGTNSRDLIIQYITSGEVKLVLYN